MSAAASLAASAPRPRDNLLPLSITVFCLLWSGAFVAGKIGVTDCPPLIFLTVRFLAAGLMVFAIAALRGETWDLSRRDVFAFAVIGIANNALYLGLGYIGLRTISAGLNALIVSANPVFVAVLASLVLGERMTWRKAIGLVLGVAGVAVIVAHRISVGSDSPVGIAFSVGALIAIVAGTMLFKLLAPKGNLWLGNGVQNLAGGLAVLPFAAMTSSVSDIVPSGRLLAAFAFLVLLVSIVAYMLWFHLLTVSGATAASAYHFVMPPLGMLFGWMILGEHVAARDLLGIVPVALGIYLVTRSASPARPMSATTSQEGVSA
ncbi:DMT family transporter [Bradyrhizobium sp. U87765 SZCCT0131]|uniref:DMT family transporter n=1 Tax=unclassified Bradyrhizobium TaxID=2631580 RepID=UPI001BAB98CC|nr:MULTISPECIES: DMT family transporter [unclassified Bradyrhizobium]MBR1221016.1 DMT family transporter [Bradyrhizobium sp. U87765 SZCCT0131]MBR1260164.1 DMT family transporter [Bradyrhizobium sp. U87765 SZCCT0134]MBR1307587.1 DMT family transporter [Bradyrhizobium sp. U87765 SZCCT0110]MBR1321541.1 DMT family transporter [Bradyrhizobium sp. U87765 SZCCT0109]MBR1349854.1 DMT family transporter [Bradyrhizobium sp. U87765 SZCCT0048]